MGTKETAQSRRRVLEKRAMVAGTMVGERLKTRKLLNKGLKEGREIHGDRAQWVCLRR